MKKHYKYILISTLMILLVPITMIIYNSKKYNNNIDDMVSCILSGGGILYCMKDPQKEVFVSKCILNNKIRKECSCRYDAMNDEIFPDGFDNIIKAWANKNEKDLYIAYAKTFGQNVLYEAVGIRSDVQKKFLNVRKVVYGKAVRKVLNKMSEGFLKTALQNARSKAIGYRMATATTNMNIIYASLVVGGVAANYSRYKVVIDHHCGGRFSQLYDYYKKYYDTKNQIGETASQYTDMYKKFISEYASGSIRSLSKSADDIGSFFSDMIPFQEKKTSKN